VRPKSIRKDKAVIRRVITHLLVIWVLSVSCVAADDLAVVLDVSGSMKMYGSWQSSARDAIVAILAGRPLPPGWTLVPNSADLSLYTCSPQAHITLLRFGTVRASAEYPYFEHVQNALTLADLLNQFPVAANDYHEARTNNALAESVAIRAVSNGNSASASRVIMLSDFLADANLSEQQLTFVNDIQGKFAKYTDATLSWAENPHVQVKLLRFVPLGESPAATSVAPDFGKLRLSQPRFDDRTESVLLAWSFEGATPPDKYGLKVTDARRGTTLFSKYNLGTRSATYPKASAGPIRWSITAYMPDGRTVEQSAAYNVPGSGGSPVAVLILVLAIASAVGTGILAVKKYGLPDFLSGFKRRKDSDI
jgi:hypothetical protein